MKPVNHKQGGFTLLELLLVIGIATVLMIASVYSYRMITEGTKATSSTRLLMTLHQKITTLAYQQEGVYTGLVYNSNSGAGDASGGNSPFVVGGVLQTGERNPFNGLLAISPAGVGNTIDIIFGNISKPACVRLIQAINSPSELVSVGTDTATYTSAANQIPVTVANATTACDQTFNTITWTFP